MYMNVKGGTHLDLNDRIKIQAELEKGSMLKVIAAIINADERTIAKEIKKRRIKFNNHRFFSLSSNKRDNNCKKILRFPYVCNACKNRKKCNEGYFFEYKAKEAQINYETILKETREGIDMTLSDKCRVDVILKEGLDKGQSIAHIYHSNKDLIPCSESTLYRLINNGNTIAQRIDTRRQVKLKPRCKRKDKNKRDLGLFNNRTYGDFLVHISKHSPFYLVEYDTVVDDSNGAHKTLLTIHFVSLHFMIIRLLDKKEASEIAKQFVYLRRRLSDDLYARMFGLGLTDRGSEFFCVDAIEGVIDDHKRLAHLFFCDSYSSYQKGALEENHTLLRYILPKGTSFNDLDQNKCDLIASHINSYYRKSINNTPYNLFVAHFSNKIADILGIKKIEANDVYLKPSLLNKIK